MSNPSFKDSITQAEKMLQSAKDDFIKRLMALPENTEIKTLSKKPNCFVVKLSQLGDNWSAEYHSFKPQYKMIADIIRNQDAVGMSKKIEDIIKNGYLTYRMTRYQVHPKVVEYLKELYYGKESSV